MKVCDFVRGILQELNQMMPDEDHLANKKNFKNHMLVKIESRKAVKKLHDFLNQYASSEAELDETILQAFRKFLRARWLYFQNTDVIYSHSPYTMANLSYTIVAKHIGLITQELSLNLLMPGKCTFNNNYKKSGTHYEMRAQDFIFCDDGKPLVILLALDKLKREVLEPSNSFEEHTRSLNDEEIARCAFHSVASAHYYAAIISRSVDKLDKARADLVRELSSDYYPVTSTYGEKGQTLLFEKLLADIHTQDDLVDLLTNFIAKEYWNLFLSLIKHEDFFRIMLGLQCSSKLSDRVLQNISEQLVLELAKPASEIHKERALIFCLLEAYERHGKNSPEYNTFLGSWVGKALPSVSGTYPKKIKLSACKALKVSLVTEKSVPAQHDGPLSSGILYQFNTRITRLQATPSEMQPIYMSGLRCS